MENIKTAGGSIFDISKPAYSNICMVLNEKGQQIKDTLRLTGNHTIVEIFREKVSMVEVETSFGITEVNEEYLWQY